MDSPRSPNNNLNFEFRNIVTNKNVLTMKSRMKVLNDLNEDDIKNKIEKEKRLRIQAIQEILTTEATYLRQLEILMEYFFQPIIDKKFLNNALFNSSFASVKALHHISNELIKELRKDTECIAEPFYKLAPFFKLYSIYAYDFEQLSTIIQAAQQKDSVFDNFIKEQETRPEVGRKLFSLLIVPIQRVPRYKLLLREVLQHTSKKHNEYNLLQACLVEVEKAALHINNAVADNEHTKKLLNLQKCIVNGVNLVRPGRKILKEGTLMRVSRNGVTAYKRYFVLLNDILIYCKGKPESSLTVRCVLPLNKCKVISVLSGGLFRITCLEEDLFLYSENGDSNSWIELLQKSIEKYTENRRTLRKDSSSRQPLRHKNLNLFQSEDIQLNDLCRKPKRKYKQQEVQLNPSRIMYFKKENQENDMEEEKENHFQLHRKSKRLKTDISTSIYTDKDALQLSVMESSNTSFSHWTDSDSTHYFTSAFKNIYEFFSYISSSVKNLFGYR